MPGERFRVKLVDEDHGGSDPVWVKVGLEGFNILSSDGVRILRKYPLHHISRWSMRGTSLILFTKSPVDVEDRTVTLTGDEYTIRSVLDTLTCSCMQMAELLQSGQGPDGAGKAAANSLNALLKKSKKPALLTADQVEFWHHPEKAGWMWSQGEHIKTWRKRWFVLKQGFVFRFANSDINSASKPRGIVDLSTVTDVSDGGAATGRPNSIKVSTAGGHIAYLCDSETAQVEWISALEGAVARIVKLVAGVDEEEEERGAARHGGGGGGRSSSSSGGVPKSWAEQLERSFAASGGGGGGSGGPSRRTSSASDRNMTISVIGYGGSGGIGGGGGSGAGPSSSARPAPRHQSSGGFSAGDYGLIKVDYGGIAGAQALPDRREPPSYGGNSGYPSYGQAPAAAPPAAPAPYQPPYMPQPQQQQQPAEAPAPAYGYGQPPAAAAGGYGGGSTLLDTVTAPQPPQPASSSPWQTHYTADGRAYYHNNVTGITQWEPPSSY